MTPTLGSGPRPGEGPIVMAALAVGLVLMSIQLWLLTVALELYLDGRGGQVWQIALASAAIFLGGVLVQWVLRRRPGLRPMAARAAREAEPADLDGESPDG